MWESSCWWSLLWLCTSGVWSASRVVWIPCQSSDWTWGVVPCGKVSLFQVWPNTTYRGVDLFLTLRGMICWGFQFKMPTCYTGMCNSDHTQCGRYGRVAVDGVYSDCVPVVSGVPQGLCESLVSPPIELGVLYHVEKFPFFRFGQILHTGV